LARLLTTRSTSHQGPAAHELGVWALWILGAVVLEAGGEAGVSETEDVWGVALILGLVSLTGIVHRYRPLQTLHAATRCMRRLIRNLLRHRVVFGIDFRRTPTLPAGHPWTHALAATGLVALAAALWPMRTHLPGDLRAWGLEHSAALTLLALTLIWAFLAAAVVLLFSMNLLYLDILRRRLVPHADHAQRRDRWISLTYVAVFGIAAFTLPPAWALLFIAPWMLMEILVSLRPGPDPIALLWRFAGRTGAPRRAGVHALNLPALLSVVAATMVLTLWACGDHLHQAGPPPHAPISSALGRLTAWFAAGLWPVLFASTALSVWRQRRANPAVACPTTVRLVGQTAHPEHADVRKALRASGLRVRPEGAVPRPGDVPVAGEPGRGRPLRRAEIERERCRAGPIAVIDADPHRAPTIRAGESDWVARARRRDQIGRRRQLIRGLNKTLKTARRLDRRGHGFWIAPHFWYVEGVSRDHSEDPIPQPLGPTYASALPLPARQHLREMLDALSIDLIFLEDGVSYPRFRRVLRMLFEHFDIHGDRCALTERHLWGLPGVRIILHEHGPDSAFRHSAYPEPDYDEIGRARILHVFRDRGEQEERVDDPFDSDAVPSAPLLMVPA